MKKIILKKKNYKSLSICWNSEQKKIFVNGLLGNLEIYNNIFDKFFFILSIQQKHMFVFWIDNYNYHLILKQIINLCKGVSFGWFVTMEITGRNYNVYSGKKNEIVFDLGFSHGFKLNLPLGIKLFFKKRIIYLYGINLILLKDVAMIICKLRRFDSYKGKGIKFLGQKVILKLGKQSQYK